MLERKLFCVWKWGWLWNSQTTCDVYRSMKYFFSFSFPEILFGLKVSLVHQIVHNCPCCVEKIKQGKKEWSLWMIFVIAFEESSPPAAQWKVKSYNLFFSICYLSKPPWKTTHQEINRTKEKENQTPLLKILLLCADLIEKSLLPTIWFFNFIWGAKAFPQVDLSSLSPLSSTSTHSLVGFLCCVIKNPSPCGRNKWGKWTAKKSRSKQMWARCDIMSATHVSFCKKQLVELWTVGELSAICFLFK